MAKAIIVSPDGIQHSQEIPTPFPFDFERDVLGDGPFNQRIAGALIELAMRDTFPEPKSNPLFTWDTLSPGFVMTAASSYFILNEKMQANAAVGEINPVSDSDIKERIDRRGVLTPNEIAEGRHKVKRSTPGMVR
tara:strand:- start:6601 stop:7005 length:405 start_codon:yes stop_codon:yes gene_type:complete